jgi:hypothetical protein
MNAIEKRMVCILKELRENYGVTGVKVAMEAEGIRLDEMLRTKEVVLRAGVDLTVKIGGCEALTDLRIAKMIGVDTVLAPMIESKFALEKFLEMVESELLPEELEDANLLINIETVDGYEKFDQILAADNIKLLNGIVLGRTDLSSALKLGDVNSPKVLSIAKSIFLKAKQKNLQCLVGGGITPKSVSFLRELKGLIDGFETRKVVFGNYNQAEVHMEEGIIHALTFEYLWYEWKQQYYGRLVKEDEAKMKGLASFINH